MSDDIKRQLDSYVRLQAVDAQVVTTHKKAKMQPRRLDDLKQEMKTAETEHAQVSTRIKERGLKIRLKEEEISTSEEKIKEYKSRLNEARDNKVYSTLLAAIQNEEESRHELESSVILLMEDLEEMEKKCAAAEQTVNDVQGRYDGQAAEIEAMLQGLKTALFKLQKRRDKVAKELTDSQVRRYERIAKSRSFVAVVPVVSGSCQGCHMKVTSQMFGVLQSSSALVLCHSCQRILYLPDEPEEAPEAKETPKKTRKTAAKSRKKPAAKKKKTAAKTE